MQETPKNNPESSELLQPALRRELLNQASQYGIENEEELFSFLFERFGFTQDIVFAMIFKRYQEEKEDYLELSRDKLIEGAVEEFVVEYVWKYVGDQVLSDTYGETPVERIATTDPSQWIVKPEIAKEIEERDIKPYDLSIFSEVSGSLRIDVVYFKGLARVANIKSGKIDFGNPFLMDLEETGRRDEMLRIVATIKLWEETNQKKVNKSGRIIS